MLNHDSDEHSLKSNVLSIESKAELIATKVVIEYLMNNKLNSTLETVHLETLNQNNFSSERLNMITYPLLNEDNYIVTLINNHKEISSKNLFPKTIPTKKRIPKRKLDFDEIYSPLYLKGKMSEHLTTNQMDNSKETHKKMNFSKKAKRSFRNHIKSSKSKSTDYKTDFQDNLENNNNNE